jgi:DNA-binding PucR family transcriptional regulator
MPEVTKETVDAVRHAAGSLAAAALARVDADHDWFSHMSADERSWIGLSAQTGIAALADRLASTALTKGAAGEPAKQRPAIQQPAIQTVLSGAPRDLIRAVTLEQTVAMSRAVVDEVEAAVPDLAAPGDEDALRTEVLRFARDVAFVSAEAFARAAEARGAWDARLASLVVDALLADHEATVLNNAAALGWRDGAGVTVLAGHAPDGDPEAAADAVDAAARHQGLPVVTSSRGDALVAVVGDVRDAVRVARLLSSRFGPGPVVFGPLAPSLTAAGPSARAALAGLRAASAWPGAPRPVAAAALLPERALDADPDALDALAAIYAELSAETGGLLATVESFLEDTGSIEATARALFVHPNTGRYRLRRISEKTGLTASEPRDAYVLRTALTVGRLHFYPGE